MVEVIKLAKAAEFTRCRFPGGNVGRRGKADAPKAAEFTRCRFPGCGGVAKKGRGREARFCSPRCRKEFYRMARQIGKMMMEGPFGCVLCRAIEIEKGRGVLHTPKIDAI